MGPLAPGQLFVLPLAGAAVVQAAEGETHGLLLLVLLGAAVTLLPPAAAVAVFPRARLTSFTAGFILLATILMVVGTATAGLEGGLLMFAALVTAFWLGVRSERARKP